MRDVSVNEVVDYYDGRIVQKKDLPHFLDDPHRFAISHVATLTATEAIVGLGSDGEEIDAQTRGTASMINSVNRGQKPNCRFVWATHECMQFVIVVALRKIRDGEELLADYGREYWKKYAAWEQLHNEVLGLDDIGTSDDEDDETESSERSESSTPSVLEDTDLPEPPVAQEAPPEEEVPAPPEEPKVGSMVHTVLGRSYIRGYTYNSMQIEMADELSRKNYSSPIAFDKFKERFPAYPLKSGTFSVWYKRFTRHWQSNLTHADLIHHRDMINLRVRQGASMTKMVDEYRRSRSHGVNTDFLGEFRKLFEGEGYEIEPNEWEQVVKRYSEPDAEPVKRARSPSPLVRVKEPRKDEAHVYPSAREELVLPAPREPEKESALKDPYDLVGKILPVYTDLWDLVSKYQPLTDLPRICPSTNIRATVVVFQRVLAIAHGIAILQNYVHGQKNIDVPGKAKLSDIYIHFMGREPNPPHCELMCWEMRQTLHERAHSMF